ncbi:twin-arginine translocation signal domain-containing protein, partial [Phytoactinopolyspora endophytica]|uniref:twin-arginine translocation signal domain-containing protein n=1 Tax=Phytoactinopolyspora endophytica TaxID=1642495 RepID=UPI001F10033D
MTQRRKAPMLDRRTFLQLSGVSSAAIALGISAPEAFADERTPVPEGVFGLGIASGEPGSRSVVLWTRLA